MRVVHVQDVPDWTRDRSEDLRSVGVVSSAETHEPGGAFLGQLSGERAVLGRPAFHGRRDFRDGISGEFTRTDSAAPRRSFEPPSTQKGLAEPGPKFRYKMTCRHRLPTVTGIDQTHWPEGVHWKRRPRIVADPGYRTH